MQLRSTTKSTSFSEIAISSVAAVVHTDADAVAVAVAVVVVVVVVVNYH